MRTIASLALITLSLLAVPASAEIVVVVHPDSPLRNLTNKQVSDLYLGRKQNLGIGGRPLILDQPRSSAMRADFYSQLNGMDVRRVDAYWARLQFSGDTLPPYAMAGDRAVIEAVRSNPLAIGYVDSGSLTGAVRTVLHLKKD